MGLEKTHLPGICRANLVESLPPLIFGSKVASDHIAQELADAALPFTGENLNAVGNVEFQALETGLAIVKRGAPIGGRRIEPITSARKPLRPQFANVLDNAPPHARMLLPIGVRVCEIPHVRLIYLQQLIFAGPDQGVAVLFPP